ncbi:hypothetical protein D3C73_1407790 [compost metagenome]
MSSLGVFFVANTRNLTLNLVFQSSVDFMSSGKFEPAMVSSMTVRIKTEGSETFCRSSSALMKLSAA